MVVLYNTTWNGWWTVSRPQSGICDSRFQTGPIVNSDKAPLSAVCLHAVGETWNNTSVTSLSGNMGAVTSVASPPGKGEKTIVESWKIGSCSTRSSAFELRQKVVLRRMARLSCSQIFLFRLLQLFVHDIIQRPGGKSIIFYMRVRSVVKMSR